MCLSRNTRVYRSRTPRAWSVAKVTPPRAVTAAIRRRECERGGEIAGETARLEPKRWLPPPTDPTLQHVDSSHIGDVGRAFFGKSVYDSTPTLQLGVFWSIE